MSSELIESAKETHVRQEGLTSAVIDDNDLFFVANRLNNTYLQNMGEIKIMPCPYELHNIESSYTSRFYKVVRFVTEKNENNRDKLVSVFQSVACFNSSIIVLIKSDGTSITFYFGTRVLNLKDTNTLFGASDVLESALLGNFPGTVIKPVLEGDELAGLLENVFSTNKNKDQKRICTVRGIAGIRSKDESPQKLFVQGMEKLVNSMQGKEYSLLVIADPVAPEAINSMKTGYEQLASQLSLVEETTISSGTNKNQTKGTNVGTSFSHSVNNSVSDSFSYAKGVNKGWQSTDGGDGWSRGKTGGSNESEQNGRSTQKGDADQWGVQHGFSEQTSEGSSCGNQYKYKNYTVMELKKKLEKQLERINRSADLGMWSCAAYCLADDERTSRLLASLYQSLLRGENSSVESSSIINWDDKKSRMIIPWLEKLVHPGIQIDLPNGETREVPLSSCVHSAELAIHAGIPQYSVSGLPVLEMASFGRETIRDWGILNEEKDENYIELGKVHHLGSDEKKSVFLDVDKINEHVFVTGSTGSGKSNTTYHMINEMREKDIGFLLIEPAKGEYKNVFGGCEGVNVYGTNDRVTDLLKLSPFSFPEGIHINEHIERLIEIFNICWPMEQAMPAVLKKAIIAAYEEYCGWNITTSEPPPSGYGSVPTFNCVIKKIKKVLNDKNNRWSDEIKGNYEGALVTRLESLTNGIYSKIFTPATSEISRSVLFDGKTIIDLSRINASETKSLIMGILMVKLQEHRIASRSGNNEMNKPLKHITVLEEAHHLLKRVSIDSGGSSSVAGKAVEMVSNGIAEMRTYGEGFIIVDQAPGLLDMAAIRNTNTKIIHKLPDRSDRELVGLAAVLNEDQITEVARLQRGVAAVYQSDWIEPVLCKVSEYDKSSYRPHKFSGGGK